MDISKAVAAYNQTNGMGGIAGKATDTASMGESNKSSTFQDLVAEGLSGAKETGYKAEAISVDALANKGELHDLVTAVSNAELTVNTVVAVRDRMVNAYQDIIKMPI